MFIIKADTPDQLRTELAVFLRIQEEREHNSQHSTMTKREQAATTIREVCYRNLAKLLEELVIEPITPPATLHQSPTTNLSESSK